MADSPSVTPTWGPGKPAPPGRGRRRTLLAVLLVLVALAGVGIGLLYWFAPPRPPASVAIWITTEPGSANPVPWAAQDRAALLESGVLGRSREDTAANPHRDQIRLRFQALAKAPRREPLVVYLAAPAAVDASGAVYVLPANPLGDHPRNHLPLVDLLNAFKDCPARNRLLVLHLTPPPENALFAPPDGELSAAIYRTLEAVPDAGRLCLIACGPGEVPHASADLGRTVFGYYLEAGLQGLADGWGGDRDGHVTVNELAAFVRSRTAGWAELNKRSQQSPTLVGTPTDFILRSYSRSRLLENYPTVPTTAATATASPFSFPEWLKAGWQQHDRWLTEGRANTAPRAYTLLRAALLDAERNLLAGQPAGEVQRALEGQLTQCDTLAKALSVVPTPDPLPTLAALFPGYVLPEPALLDELRAASTRADAAPSPAVSPDKPAAPPALPAEFDAFKAKPYPVLALTVFVLLTEDSPSAAQMRRFAQLLAMKEPVPKFAEALLIQRLAVLAAPDAIVTWSPQRAALALQTARNLEDAAAQPELVWSARPALDVAYRLRADAEAFLFAPGYAPTEEADNRLKQAAAATLQLRVFANQLRLATATRGEALRWLTGLTPAVEAGAVPLSLALPFAESTKRLEDALPTAAQPITPAELGANTQLLRDRVLALNAALEAVKQPFRADALARMRARLEAGEVDPTFLAEVDAFLRTPLLATIDRAALWNAWAVLARRLCDDTLRKDAAADESFRRDLAEPLAPDPRLQPNTLISDPERTTRRTQWSLALLGVGGYAETTQVAADLVKFIDNPPAFDARLHRVWLEEVPAALTPQSARLARIMPAFPSLAFLNEPARNPDTLLRQSQSRAEWAWQAARFTYESLDSSPTESGQAFSTAAARTCAAAANPSPEPYLELDAVPGLTLKADQLESEFGVKLRLLGSAERRSVAVNVFTPSAEWVKAVGKASAEFDPIRGEALKFQVAVGERPALHPQFKGVLVEATLADGRTYHRRVPVALDDLVNRLTLVVRPLAEDAKPVRSIELRPNGDPQPFEVRLENPGRKAQTVIVRLPQYDRETEKVTVAAGQDVKLKFKLPPPTTPPPVPATAPKDPTPIDPFEPVKGSELEVLLLDPANPEKVLQRFRVPVQVLDPSQYILIDQVAFTPAVGARPNRLQIDILPGKVPPGPAVTVAATLPFERNPDVLRVQDANLSAPLPPAGKPLTLYAENTTFKSSSGANVLLTIAADETERIFTYRGFLPPLGGTVQLNPITYPMVRVRAKPLPLEGQEPAPQPPPTGPLPRREYVEPVYASGLVPLPLELEVDNAPEGATVQIRLGTLRPDNSGKLAFLPDVTLPLSPAETPIPAKDRKAKVMFDAKGEMLTFKGSQRDPRAVLPIEVLVGERVIEARLIGRNGKPLTDPESNEVVGRTRVIFDGAKPSGIAFVALEPRLPQGKTVLVRATSDLPVSGVKEVKFFLGRPVKDGPPPAATPVPGVLFDPKANEWRGVLPIEGLKDKHVIGVQVISKAGQERAISAEVELVDPAELNKPLPGTIAGTVTDNAFKQKDLKVFLYDAGAKPLKETTTNSEGFYEFKDLPPATYFIYSYHVPTRRDKKLRVDLKPGAKEIVNLELVLGGAN